MSSGLQMENLSDERTYDVVIWGATGYTGRLAAEYMNSQCRLDSNGGLNTRKMTWAIAGRSLSGLNDLMKKLTRDSEASCSTENVSSEEMKLIDSGKPQSVTRVSADTGANTPATAMNSPELEESKGDLGEDKADVSSVCTQVGNELLANQEFELPGFIVANSMDERSMAAMTSQCRVIISCAGPYTVCGESVIKACVETNTHYIDITAELPWVTRMKNLYNEEAIKKNLKLIVCCGFDFVPNDMMMLQLSEILSETSNSSKVKWSKKPSNVVHSFRQSTPTISGGTALSGMHLFRYFSLTELFAYYFDPYSMISTKDRESISEVVQDLNSRRLLPTYVPESRAYCTPFVMSSLMSKFVHWSNHLQNNRYGNNLLYQGGESHTSLISAFARSLLIWLQVLSAYFLSRFDILWQLLPKPGTGQPICPESSFMESVLVAAAPPALCDDQPLTTDPFKSVKISWNLRGGEAYLAAAIFAVEGARTLIQNASDLPSLCGIITPAAALGYPYLTNLKRTPIEMKTTIVEPEIVFKRS